MGILDTFNQQLATESKVAISDISEANWGIAIEQTIGEGQAHNNVQPSIVDAQWRRTA